MDLLDLFVRITARDETSEGVESASQNIIGKLASAAKKAAKALAGMWAVKKVYEFGRAAFDAYAEYEQLVGGVDKLFGEASDKLQEYAQQAYATSGMSANQYMQQVTSFSAALINSLGGDTAKAADQADVAMRAISDNVNTFGTDMESVQTAYQGFAKQNYTMLDNLKLGYGGTKTEMERLIADANEYAASIGQASDLSIDSFSDVVTAIELIQEKQGIAGTTAREAMGTIEGSMNMTKAAWQNLVTEFGKPDADIGARVSEMITAVFGQNGEGGLARNVVNEVRVIATNMVSAVSQAVGLAVDWLVTNGPSMLGDAMKKVGDALKGALSSLSDFRANFNLVEAIFGSDGSSGIAGAVSGFLQDMASSFLENWPYIQEQLGGLWDEYIASIETFAPQVGEVVLNLITAAASAVMEYGPDILASLGDVISTGLHDLGRLVGEFVAMGVEFIGGLITGTSDEGKALHQWFADFFPDGLLNGLGDFATFLLDAGKALIDGLLDGIGEVAPEVEQAIRDAFQVVLDFFGGVAQFLEDPVGAIKSGLSALGGAFLGTEDDAESSMSGVESSVGKAMDSAKRDIGSYNRTKLNDKNATVKVTGNAVDGTGKTRVSDMAAAVGKLNDKTVNLKATGNAVDGTAKNNLQGTLDLIGRMRDKTINVTTNQRTVTQKPTGSAWGGIHYLAEGGIRIADRFGPGVSIAGDVRAGERGAEAIVPLTSRYGGDFARMMGQEASKYMGGGTTVNVYLDYNAGEDATKLVNDIADGLRQLDLIG